MSRDAAERLALEPDVGHVSDSVIAARLGISRKTVLAWRKRRGIRAFDDPTPAPPPQSTARATAAAPASPAAPAPPGPSSPGAASPARKSKPSRLDALAHLLGTLPDREVALQAGVSPENVRMYRQRRGIPAQWREGDGPPTRVERALAAVEDELGRAPDAEIAARVGVSRSAVTQYRARHNIPAGRRDAPIPAPTPATPERLGFAVTVRGPAGEETVTVLAPDAASAALAAARVGEVLVLRRVGRVL